MYNKKEKLLVVRFNSDEEIQDFLSSHKDLCLLDKKKEEFLVIETENTNDIEYVKKIVARFTSQKDKVIISELEQYKKLSDNAKKIINCLKVSGDFEDIVEIQLGGSFKGINITSKLYYEIFNFSADVGINLFRHNNITQYCLSPDILLRLE